MDQEKIGKFIKDIRLKQKMTQQEFANKWGVTYQAVSKWENGKNLPDIAILKEMCLEYNINLDDILLGEENKKKNNQKYFWIIGIIILIIFLSLIYLIFNRDSSFEFKTLSASCNNFEVTGSIAYNTKKSSIYISHITYCGGEDNKLYKNIECVLYESNGNTKTQVSEYDYSEGVGISLETFLETVTFNVHDYTQTCKNYADNSLFLEIDAIDMSGNSVFYKIPFTLEDNCNIYH